jgi:hypothetical protein
MKTSPGKLPDFIIIGAAKAGTTSLDFYLSLHPQIQMAKPKEPRFFIDAPEPLGRWQKGTDWYRQLFQSSKPICGEASPAYSHWPALPNVPERIATCIPHAKLIYLVREPMQRIKSHYLMHCRFHCTNQPLADFLQSDHQSHCLLASNYGSQLQQYLNWFPLKQILVMESSQLEQNTNVALREIFKFLNADPDFSSPLFKHRQNTSKMQPIPNKFGGRIRNSKWMKQLQKKLPPSLFYHWRNCLAFPFRLPAPSMDLPAELQAELHSHLTLEMNLLRSLCGKELPSLNHF